MVSFHFLDLERFLADGTNALLPLIGFSSLLRIKSPDVKVLFLAAKHIRIDAPFIGDVPIFHQFGYLDLKLR